MDLPARWHAPTMMTEGQHALCAGKSIPVPTWISMQKWNNPHGRQAHYTDAAVGNQMIAGGLQLSSSSCFLSFKRESPTPQTSILGVTPRI